MILRFATKQNIIVQLKMILHLSRHSKDTYLLLQDSRQWSKIQEGQLLALAFDNCVIEKIY